jgi:ribosomal protein L7/L12
MVQASRKLRAIKFIRRVSGWGLRESKDFVDTVICSDEKELVFENGRFSRR